MKRWEKIEKRGINKSFLYIRLLVTFSWLRNDEEWRIHTEPKIPCPVFHITYRHLVKKRNLLKDTFLEHDRWLFLGNICRARVHRLTSIAAKLQGKRH